MKLQRQTFAAYHARFSDGCSSPEYRQIELYTKKKKLSFREEAPEAEGAASLSNPLSALVAFSLLDAELESRDLSLEGRALWPKYLGLPRKTTTEKLVAEVYRILRIYRTGLLHTDGRFELHNGNIKIDVNHGPCALALWISPVGLKLLEGFVHYYLSSTFLPYSESYVEAVLTEYFLDIVSEIKKFNDEDRILYQFQRRYEFNRHFRFDCDNPRVEPSAEHLSFEIGERHIDKARFPIDFYVVINDVLHIVPVEALRDGRLPNAELSCWLARTPDGISLPTEFRTRFGREKIFVCK
jgi:hypothetical protein